MTNTPERTHQDKTSRNIDQFNGPLTGDEVKDQENYINQLKAMGNKKDELKEAEAKLEQLKQRKP